MYNVILRLFDWVVRALIILAGMITGLFVARDAAHFGVLQMFVLLTLIAACIAALALWPTVVSWLRRKDCL